MVGVLQGSAGGGAVCILLGALGGSGALVHYGVGAAVVAALGLIVRAVERHYG